MLHEHSQLTDRQGVESQIVCKVPHIPSYTLQSLKNFLSILYILYVAHKTRNLSNTLTRDSQEVWCFSLANLNSYTLSHHHIYTLYCRSPHISIYTLICLLQQYKLCPATPNDDLSWMNKMLISEKDYIKYFPLPQYLENVVWSCRSPN